MDKDHFDAKKAVKKIAAKAAMKPETQSLMVTMSADLYRKLQDVAFDRGQPIDQLVVDLLTAAFEPS